MFVDTGMARRPIAQRPELAARTKNPSSWDEIDVGTTTSEKLAV
jgi:hypothetical protein